MAAMNQGSIQGNGKISNNDANGIVVKTMTVVKPTRPHRVVTTQAQIHAKVEFTIANLTERTMRSWLIVPAITILAVASAAADAPFVTNTTPPDYTIAMIEKYNGEVTYTFSRTVTHHGDWTRVDVGRDTEYYSTEGVYMRLSDGGYLSMQRDRERSPRVNTGDRQTYLGESCTVWAKNDDPSQSDASDLSCVTDDGIELWQRSIVTNDVISSVEATRIERRPVTPDEVHPPRGLLSLDWWGRFDPGVRTPVMPDHEIVMEPSRDSIDAQKSIRTTRRLGPWQFDEKTVDGLLHYLSITHASGRISLGYTADTSGAPKSLAIERPDSRAASQEPSAPQSPNPRVDLKRSETILGETCHWFNMTPIATDSGSFECLTNDGIALKIDSSDSLNGTQSWTAVKLTRRPVSLDEIKPPAWLLDPQLWGID
jgi:hypothetical protein